MSVMSQDDIDRLVGQWSRQKAEARRQLNVIREQLAEIRSACEKGFAKIQQEGDPDELLMPLKAVEKFVDIAALRAILLERNEAGERYREAIERLRGLGID